MLVLFETPAGHALFKLQNDAAIRSADRPDLESESTIKNLVKLKAFSRFTDTTAALAAATALVEGKPSKDLRKFLKKQVKSGEHIAVADSKLGAAIKDKTGLQCVFDSGVNDLMRGIRCNIEALLEGESEAATGSARSAMVLGLAHSLSRYKLKFSPDKVDTMIVQAISLLDELDKEVNIYAMRLREWFGWHFPEMGKIVTDNAEYARAVDKMGIRTNVAGTDFDGILSEDVEAELKQAALVSMGTEISDQDVMNIRMLCSQVIGLTDYRANLYEYLKNRMAAIAPNLTAMVGELVGARLISHAGSLLSLAKYPASTVQILGAEKALFRALKTKHATPKYGLIFHASVVGQATPKHKGKISRSLAAKTSLCIRVDALGDSGEDASVGEQGRLAIEKRLNQLEGRTQFAISRLRIDDNKQGKYKPGADAGKGLNDAGDFTMTPKKESEAVPSPAVRKAHGEAIADEAEEGENGTTESGKKKKKKKKDKKKDAGENGSVGTNGTEDPETPKKKEKKKRKRDVEEAEETPSKENTAERKKKKKKK